MGRLHHDPLRPQSRARRPRRGLLAVSQDRLEQDDSVTSPRNGERSKPKASGEGDSPRTELVEVAPHPNPLPAKSGAREKWSGVLQLKVVTL
ncbi:MAG: hypothetical protein E6G70_10310 [Alphaproteobacteria bacterium]|nr:MAG: hypothetical protein E6G70_10310 [Alphaproteobacteria bacterium]